ncbi:hypothetical protein Trydic_g8348 [Trypoxylus dichotomus]
MHIFGWWSPRHCYEIAHGVSGAPRLINEDLEQTAGGQMRTIEKWSDAAVKGKASKRAWSTVFNIFIRFAYSHVLGTRGYGDNSMVWLSITVCLLKLILCGGREGLRKNDDGTDMS